MLDGSRVGSGAGAASESRRLTKRADGDTLFFFNYRSDRMREIATVFGLPDKPMEVDVPKDLVSRSGKRVFCNTDWVL